MRKIDWNGVIKVLLVLAAICTTAYLLILGWFNTLSLDDYGNIIDLSDQTPWENMKNMYMTWQGRFSGVLVGGCLCKIWTCTDALFSWTIIHLVIGYVIAYLYTRDVQKIKDKVTCCAIAVLVSNITIMSVLEISTFYWLCCANYFLMIYLSLLLFYVLFASHWKGWVNTVIAILCALYVCGSAENYTPLVLMILGIIWLIDIIRDTKQLSFKDAFFKHWLLLVVCAILGIGFIVMLVAPGNKVRMMQGDGELRGFMYNFDLILFIKKTIIANVVFMLRVLSRFLYWLGVLPVFIYAGRLMRDNNAEVLQVKLWKGIAIATLLLLGFIFIAITSCVYGLGYYPPLRSMSFVSYVVVVHLAYVGCLLGRKIAEKKEVVINGLVAICTVGWIAFASFELYREYPEVKRYHDYVTQRDKLIQKMVYEGNTETLYVDGFKCPEWNNTYFYLRTAINRCVGSKKIVDEPYYFPYMVSELNKDDEQIDFKSEGLRDYYHAQFDIFEK